MVDVFTEVDEDLRHEKLKALAKKFGPYLVLAIVLFIGAMGGQVYWEDHVKNTRIAESERYNTAMTQLQAGDSTSALAGLDTLIAKSEYGYGLLSRLQVASFYAKDGQMDKALSAYDAITADGNVEDRFRDFASLMAAGLLMDMNAGEEVFQRLIPLAREAGSWQYSAKELIGLAYFRQGNWQAAEEIFSDLVLSQGTPQDLRNRAQEFMAMIEVAKPAEDLFNIVQGNETLADEEESVADGEEPGADE